MVRQFTFAQTTEDIEIAGRIYQLPLDDNSLLHMQELLLAYGKEADELSKRAVPDNDSAALKARFDDQKNLCERIVDGLLGDGSFPPLYEAAGQSISNMIDLIGYLADIIAEKSEQKKQQANQSRLAHYSSNRPKRKKKR